MKVVLLCWRDTRHPEGGGSERYLEEVGHYLAAQGHDVVFRTAKYPGARRSETEERDGHLLRFSRGGGNLSVYPRALVALLAARLGLPFGPFKDFGRPDVIVDTQNGVPFFASVVAGAPTVVLTHHCHREQWSVAGPVLSWLGWLIESKISPWLHRKNTWVTVSRPSAEEFAELGVPRERLQIIRNGIDPVPNSVAAPSAAAGADGEAGASTDAAVGQATGTGEAVGTGQASPSSDTLHLVTLSRLVPHKQIEHALDALAAVRADIPNVRLDVIGDGWWSENLREYARELGVEANVVFHGHVSEEIKHRILSRAALHVMPSRKEGWGLAVIEAAQHGVPTVGYKSSAGLRDSVIQNETGILAGSPGGLINAVEHLLLNHEERHAMGQAAVRRASGFSWDATGQAWNKLLTTVVGRGR